MRARPVFRLLALAFAFGSLAHSATGQEPADPAPARPRIGLVLSGGGARGAAHVGVLKVLEELRIPVDVIAGTSMGALVAGLYAYGYSPAEMEATLAEIDWPLLLSDWSLRQDRSFRRKQDDFLFQVDWSVGFRDFDFVLPKGLVTGHHSGNLLRFLVPESFAISDFAGLRIPYRAVATEIATGNRVVLSTGDLPLAMAASMAIPGVFAPVVVDGRELVDGMVVNNLPIDVVQEMGADVVIAVDIGAPLLDAQEIRSLLDVTEQILGILVRKNVDAQVARLTPADTLIRPDLGDITPQGFERTLEAIPIGESAARASGGRLERYSVSEAEYERFLARQRRPPVVYPIVDRIAVENDSRLSDEALLALVKTKVGQRVDPARVQRDIDRIFGLEEFERVTANLRPTTPDHADLVFRAVAKSWGPNYLNFALNLEDDVEGDAAYSVGVRYTMRTLNSLGAEWRNELQVGEPLRAFTEFYQPLDPAARTFVAALAEYDVVQITSFTNGKKDGEFDVSFVGAGVDAGAHFDNWAELRLGVRRAHGDVDPDLTATPTSRFTFDDGYLRAGLEVDTLDDAHFPTAGNVAAAEWVWARESLGADDAYERLEVGAGHALSFGTNTLVALADFGTALDEMLPVYRPISRGGFLNLSGFPQGGLTGEHGATARLVGYRRIAGTPLGAFGMPIYTGASIETGNVTDDRDDLFDDPILAGSVFLGISSPIGPIYLAFGLAEGGNDSAYFIIGRPF